MAGASIASIVRPKKSVASESDAEFRKQVRSEFVFVQEQLRDIKTTLDLILKTLQVDEETSDRV